MTTVENNLANFGASPVLSCAEAKHWEESLLKTRRAAWVAMEAAGAALGRAVLEDAREAGGFPDDGSVLVLVGKGHNGGDALLAARTILAARRRARARVVLCFGAAALRPLARRSLARLKDGARGRVEVISAEKALRENSRYALCLDGIFGFQFRPPVDPAVASLVERVNAHRGIALRAAVDLPSGVGEGAAAPMAFRADFTYATGIVKTPVVAPIHAKWVGRLRYLDLGFFDHNQPTTQERVLTTDLLEPLRTLRPAQTDKRTFGHVLIVGGSRSYPGAVMLAVRAALRSGAGLVTAFVPKALAPEYAAAHPEAMWVGCPETKQGGLARGTVRLVQERLPRATALLIGPGLSAEPGVLATVRAILERTKDLPVVVDADALRPEIVTLLRHRRFICTPHAGEFARIEPALFRGKKLMAAHGVIVRKAPLTQVVDDGATYYSPFGGPVLARGGSGDILAGLTAGLLAQQPVNPLLAACRGVVWHGRAADLLARACGQVAVEVSQILEQLGPGLQPDPCLPL